MASIDYPTTYSRCTMDKSVIISYQFYMNLFTNDIIINFNETKRKEEAGGGGGGGTKTKQKTKQNKKKKKKKKDNISYFSMFLDHSVLNTLVVSTNHQTSCPILGSWSFSVSNGNDFVWTWLQNIFTSMWPKHSILEHPIKHLPGFTVRFASLNLPNKFMSTLRCCSHVRVKIIFHRQGYPHSGDFEAVCA